MISTRGRYALRVMLDLAENENGSYIPLKDIAARQELSKKYLLGIWSKLDLLQVPVAKAVATSFVELQRNTL